MNNKRPRPTVPVLVHVENPTEAASITVDTSKIEGQLDTVIENQEKIYDKIPTLGGSSTDLTTVNEKTTQLATAVGQAGDSYGSLTVLGLLKNINQTTGDKTDAASAGTIKAVLGNSNDSNIGTIMGRLNNISNVAGKKDEVAGNGTINSHLFSLQRTLGSIDDAEGLKTIKAVLGNASDGPDLHTIMGRLNRLWSSVGAPGDNQTVSSLMGRATAIKNTLGVTTSSISANNIIGVLSNLRNAVGNANVNDFSEIPGTVRGLLADIKTNTAKSSESADLTTVNTNTTSIAHAIGDTDDNTETDSIIGLLKRIIQHG